MPFDVVDGKVDALAGHEAEVATLTIASTGKDAETDNLIIKDGRPTPSTMERMAVPTFDVTFGKRAIPARCKAPSLVPWAASTGNDGPLPSPRELRIISLTTTYRGLAQ